jgi:hypothetical protein
MEFGQDKGGVMLTRDQIAEVLKLLEGYEDTELVAGRYRPNKAMQATDILRKALVGSGCVVPDDDEPTEAMLAVKVTQQCCLYNSQVTIHKDTLRAVWKAMLAAAPSAKGER